MEAPIRSTEPSTAEKSESNSGSLRGKSQSFVLPKSQDLPGSNGAAPMKPRLPSRFIFLIMFLT